MLLLKSFTSPYLHKPHIKGEESFSDSGGLVGLVRSPHFLWRDPPTSQPNCYRASNFWVAQPPFRAHHVSQLKLPWFMNFITHFFRHWKRCHKLFVLVKNHVSQKSEICVFFMTWMIELWWIIECVGESKRQWQESSFIPPPRFYAWMLRCRRPRAVVVTPSQKWFPWWDARNVPMQWIHLWQDTKNIGNFRCYTWLHIWMMLNSS